MTTEELFDSCLPLAWQIVNAFSRTYPRLHDDFQSDALLALWRAALDYDPSRAKFSTFATVMVRRTCLHTLCTAKRRTPASLTPDDLAARQPPVGAALEARDELARLPADLVAEGELSVEGFAEKDIDDACGISRQGRHDRRKRILRRLQSA
jgi:RNA polymerase sigma factor (sigma-70 family)